MEQAERRSRSGRGGANCAMARCPNSRSSLSAAEARLRQLQADGALLKEEVDADEIAAVVSRWTGVPVSRLLEGEVEKLLRMEERLHERVIGQDEAVHAVAAAVRRSRAGLQDPNRPVGTLYVPGADRRRQDRTGTLTGGIHVR